MLFSCEWLRDYVELPADPEELARRLTAAGLAVEGVAKTDDGDAVLDVDVTTNRVDAMNHLGVAREVAVLTGRPLSEPQVSLDEAAEATSGAVEVTIEAPELCSRYAARVIRGVSIGPSPEWLARRLRAIGLRPINNVVDVTNYVLWETGQPLHGFDLAKVMGAEIRVREARAGERLVTLDGETRKLAAGMLVIADSGRPVALAGVMGGAASEVTGATRDVLLESAWFDPASVRSTAKALAMHSDASHRFERGVDPELQARAAERAAALIAELAGGTVLAGTLDVLAPGRRERHARPTILLDLDRLDAFGGAPMPAGKPAEWLQGLGFEVEPAGDRTLSVTVPSWRLDDVSEAADLFEEVLRIHGYDAIPSSLPALGEPDAPPTPRQLLRGRVRRLLAGCGFAEAIDYAFYSAEDAAAFPALGEGAEGEAPVLLANPLSELYAVMRRSLLPGLLASARFNTRRGADAVRLFELGTVFGRRPDGTVVEREILGLVCGGSLGTPWEGTEELDLFHLKGVLEALATDAGLDSDGGSGRGSGAASGLEARPADIEGLREGASAELLVGGRRRGILGRVAAGEEAFPLWVAELELAALEVSPEALEKARQVEAPPRVPGIEADLTFTHSLDVPWAEIDAAIREAAAPELARFGLKDRYQGEGVPEGAVNTTIAFLYHGGERQLTQDEVNSHQQALARRLEERFGGSGDAQETAS